MARYIEDVRRRLALRTTATRQPHNRLYRRLLEEEKNEDKRALIRTLLAEEEARDVPATPRGTLTTIQKQQ
ncbi:bsl7667 [Bradyrhizobium diazoefficiens USDA 110]|uniref:Bsl7667 protein n=1 Tax=Bradyrhizobium diazoefficiens (strain JCM 10833 / BCRC 13528 / IAM 13628 / NBRC 14792 / USDA 110) TaxID=224911 RepID=Q89CX8_BRADU|nr:hypothetical protein AAV28_36050 [Bradyrhizobium diazoefficiens USDA 110]PDT56996.1 hypothetical protein CO678_35965 [Bradyrhizobium diazoefficiens]QBP26408.1 hypothetical protein Bdiaspc4_40515 [Bradyrhizobium diazoefficiens]BAC52932.1 bsl7667 [Bradyrhizobium diazoefficiens USDA 110]BCA07543.1 hypothetical protein H12S4_84470 [Bradyrhizobium diazoefficiens]